MNSKVFVLKAFALIHRCDHWVSFQANIPLISSRESLVKDKNFWVLHGERKTFG